MLERDFGIFEDTKPSLSEVKGDKAVIERTAVDISARENRPAKKGFGNRGARETAMSG